MGDLNSDLLLANSAVNALQSLCTAVKTTKKIKDPTRVTRLSSTIIDIILTSDSTLVKTSGLLETSISDHFLVQVALDLKMPKSPNKMPNTSCHHLQYNANQFFGRLDLSRRKS